LPTPAASRSARRGRGAKTTSLDLSKKYLEWGRRNFTLNGLDPAAHDFIYGDAFRLAAAAGKERARVRRGGARPADVFTIEGNTVFSARKKTTEKLVTAALPLVKPGGVLFASTNAVDWPPEKFLADVERAIYSSQRKILQRHHVPQPPDFPISRAEPAYLKTVWLRIGYTHHEIDNLRAAVKKIPSLG